MSCHALCPSLSQGDTPPTEQKPSIPDASGLPVLRRTPEERCTAYGIVVLSASGKILYVNQTASRYLKTADGSAYSFVLAVEEFIRQMTKAREPGGLARPPVATTRLVHKEGSPVLLQAFGLRDPSSLALTRVVIIMHNYIPAVTSAFAPSL